MDLRRQAAPVDHAGRRNDCLSPGRQCAVCPEMAAHDDGDPTDGEMTFYYTTSRVPG
jgi:hypothetical protein